MPRHIIVCGMGQVGYRVVRLLLRLGERVTVVTLAAREEWKRAAQERGVTVVIGDARDEQRLVEAGLREAQALIVATDRDLANIEIALDARRLRPDLPIVVRLFDPGLAHQLEASFDLRRAFGMSSLAAPSFASAALGDPILGSFSLDAALYVLGRLVVEEGSPLDGMALSVFSQRFGLAVLGGDDAGAGRLVEEQPDARLTARASVVVIGAKRDWDRASAGGEPRRARRRVRPFKERRKQSHAAGLFHLPLDIWRGSPAPLRHAFIALNLLIFLSVFVFHLGMRLSFLDALYFVVSTVTTTGYGDISPGRASGWLKLYGCLLMVLGSATLALLYSIITDFVVTNRFRQLVGRQRVPEQDHVVLVGVGNVGYRIAEELRRAEMPFVAVERRADAEFIEAVRPWAEVIAGDARAPETLDKAHISRAAAVIAATNDDAVNLSVGLAAKRNRPGVRAVVRMFDADFARKAQTALQIDVALSASAIAAPPFAAAALFPDVRGAFVLGDQLLVLLERPAPGEWASLTPAELWEQHRLRVLMRSTAPSAPYSPAGNSGLAAGERLLVAAWRPLAAEP